MAVQQTRPSKKAVESTPVLQANALCASLEDDLDSFMKTRGFDCGVSIVGADGAKLAGKMLEIAVSSCHPILGPKCNHISVLVCVCLSLSV
jgi:hypothetical protein